MSPSESDPAASEPRSIATWVRDDAGARRYCTRPWRQATVLSDGTAVCACIDAEKTNPLGDLTTKSFDEVWNGPEYVRLRRAIARNIDAIPICRGCPHRIEGPKPPEDYLEHVEKPRALYVESHIGCNLACPGCNRDGMIDSRASQTLDLETYKRVIDALSPELRYMEFHVGGENYMHKQAHEMVRYCREKNPHCVILSSTNGHFFHTEDRQRGLLESGIDCVVFSVDGATQESYEKYRVNGRLDRVLDGMRAVAAMRKERGQDGPLLVWRYILFKWNDSDEEMALARKLAAEVGVDHLTWHLNAVPDMVPMQSERFYVGSPRLPEIEHELWDTLPARLGVGIDVDWSTYR
ncbi:MAG: SPASM domain-containing protein [Planctomycetota bacterium JB042]